MEPRKKTIMELLVEWDTRFFFLVNKKMRNSFLNLLMLLITQLGNGFLTLVLCAVFFYSFYHFTGIKETEVMVLATAVAIFSTIVVQTAKNFFRRKRPAKDLKDVQVLGPVLRFSSFPSGHTVSAFALAALLADKYPVLALIFYFTAFLVGVSRIYVGAHYPLDVLAGSLVGVGCTKIILLLVQIW